MDHKVRIEEFEDLVAWQKARALVNEIYKVTGQGRFAKDFGLASQIQRAGVSVMSNIAEGFERGNRAEFHQALSVAKASCGELRSQLYVALDTGYLTEDMFNSLIAQAREVGRIVGGLRASVARQRDEQRPNANSVLSPYLHISTTSASRDISASARPVFTA